MKIFAITATLITMSAALVAVFFLYDTKGAPKEAKVVQMCRDDIIDGDSSSRGRQIAAMMKDGWQYAGPLHANGINCAMNLFVR